MGFFYSRKKEVWGGAVVSLNLSMIGRWKVWRGFYHACMGLRVYSDEEDRVSWIETKNDKFTMKLLYTALELGISSSFP